MDRARKEDSGRIGKITPIEPSSAFSRTLAWTAAVPPAMGVLGFAVVIAARMTGERPDWLERTWAIWMTVACFGALPALIAFGVLRDRKRSSS